MGSSSGVVEGKCHSKKPVARHGVGAPKFQIRKDKLSEVAKGGKKNYGHFSSLVKSDAFKSGQNGASDSSELDTIFETYRRWENLPTAVTLDELFEATKKLRILVGKEDSVPGITQIIINRGGVPVLVKLLFQATYWSTVYEAVYALVNVTFVDGAIVFECPGAIQQLANLLGSNRHNIREVAAHCLGNIACESTRYRDAILATPHAVDGLVRNLQEPANEEVLKTVSWACKILLLNKPRNSSTLARRFVPAIVTLLENCEGAKIDVASRVDTVVSLETLMGGGTDILKFCFECRVLEPLMDLVRNHSASSNRHIMVYTVRAIGQLAVSDDATFTDEVIRLGFLDYAPALLDHKLSCVREEACWTLSSIASGSQPHAYCLLHAGHGHAVVRRLLYLAVNGTYRIRIQAAFAVCSLVISVRSKDVPLLERLEVTAILVQVLRMVQETKLLVTAMNALDRIFHICGKAAVVKFEELDGEGSLEELQSHLIEEVYLKAYELLTKYFDLGESFDDDISSLGPPPDDSISFSLPSKQLFPAECAAFSSPLTTDVNRPFSGFELSPNIMDMSLGDIVHV